MSGIIMPNTYPQIEVKNEFYSKVEPNPDNTSGPYKVLLLGDAAVGKTSLIKRLITGKFLDKTDSNYIATIGIDYKRKTIRIEENKFVKLQIWDTAGQERFRGLAKNYYRGADAVVLVYDVTQARTFVDVPSWLEELETFSIDERKILQVIVANKVDLASERQVSTLCGQALADKFKLDYIETSARSGFNVDLVFHLLAHSLALAHLNSKSAIQKIQEQMASTPKPKTEAKLRDFKRQRKRRNEESFRIEQQHSRSLDYTTVEERRQEEEGNCCVA